MSTTLDRRHFLGASLAALTSLRAAEPKAKFPRDPRQRLAVATYPFRFVIASPAAHDSAPNQSAQTGKPRMSLAEFAASLREQFNVSGIEPWSRHFESVEPEYVRNLSQSFQKSGIRVVNIPCDIRVQLCATPAERADAIEAYRKWIDAASILGSPSIRIHVPKTQPPGDFNCIVSGLKAVAECGGEKNIVINLENDNPQTEDPFLIVKAIEAVNSPFLRALPDFCNSRQLGDEDYNDRALRALFPHAYNISHVKDQEFHNGVLRVDLDRIFAIARQANYRGYFSMEFSSNGTNDPYEGTKQLLQASLRNLNQTTR